MWDLQEEPTPVAKMRLQNFMASASPSVRQDSASRHDSISSVNSNIQKSILLLNESLTPGTKNFSSLRGGKLPKMTSFNQSLNVTGFDTTNVDDLLTMSKSKIEEINKSSAHPSFLDASNEHIISANVTTDPTMHNADYLLDEDHPGIQITSGLFNDFLNALVEQPSQYQIFELVQKYEQCCSDQIELLEKLQRRIPPSDNKFSRIFAVMVMLQNERDTWRLLRTLYQDRVHSEADPESLLIENIGSITSDETIIKHFYRADSLTRQSQLVIDWLEQKAADQLRSSGLKHFADTSVPWENTLHFLNKQQSYAKFSSNQSIVDQMDPDAPIRQKRHLHDLDKEDDSRMFKLVFINIRGGSLDKAQEIALNCGQPWLAAALEGWRLYHDPNYCSSESSYVVDSTGNVFRDTWKSVCWNMANDEFLSTYERGIYAAYSGNLKLLLKTCESWDDYLWAYLRVMVDQRVEQELRENTSTEEEMDALPDTYWAKRLGLEKIFAEIEASSNRSVQEDSKNFYHIMQKYIILDDIDGLLEQMHDIIEQHNSRPSHHMLRFIAHLTLFLRTIGRYCKEELGNKILEAYVQDLIKERRIRLVAYYVATLPNQRQVDWYAKFLEGIKDKEERRLCLKLAEDVNLDVALITKTVVENIRNKETVDDVESIHAKTTPDDIMKIEAIDWLVFDESQRSEAMKQANALMRKFIACKKIDATKSVFAKIPSNSIDIIMKYIVQTGLMDLPPEDENATREYICIQAYLQAHDAFNDWFEHFNHSKPTKPKLQSCRTFSEQISQEHQMKQYESDLERWSHALSLQTKVVQDAMYNVLLFIDGGWMVDQRKDAPANQSRSRQLELLRQICIPQVTILLHSVLHATHHFKESIQLADIIASEQNQLYKVFNKEELKLFLSKVKDSSLELLNENMDSVGYHFD